MILDQAEFHLSEALQPLHAAGEILRTMGAVVSENKSSEWT